MWYLGKNHQSTLKMEWTVTAKIRVEILIETEQNCSTVLKGLLKQQK